MFFAVIPDCRVLGMCWRLSDAIANLDKIAAYN
jgi:hypothetical protein